MVNPFAPNLFGPDARRSNIDLPKLNPFVSGIGVADINPFISVPQTQKPQQVQQPQPTIQDVEQPGFEFAFGFFPTINPGNIFGVNDDTLRTILNIVLDPIGLATVFLSGGATIAGKAALATKSLSGTKSVLKAAKGVTAAERVTNAQKIFVGLAKAETNPAAVDALKLAIAAKDVKAFKKATRALQKTKVDDKFRELIPTRVDLFDLENLSKAEKGLARAGKTLADIPLTPALTRVGRVEAGQSAAIKGGIPFTNIEKIFVPGKPLAAFFDALLPASARLTKKTGAKATVVAGITVDNVKDLFKTSQGARYTTEVDAVQTAARFRRETAEAVNAVSNDGVNSGLGKVVTFFQEKVGIPVSVIEKLGLTDDFVRAGVTPKKLDRLDIFSHDDLVKVLGDKGWLEGVELSDKMLRGYYDDLRKTFNASTKVRDLNYIEDYITHFWDIDKKLAKTTAKSAIKKGVFQNKRTLENFIEGMNKGHTLKFDDAFEIAEEYHKIMGRVIANEQMLDTLKDGKILLDGVKGGVPLVAGRKFLKNRNILDQYVLTNNTEIIRALGKSRGASVYIHKDLIKNLDIIFQKPLDNAAVTLVDNFISTAKTLSLSSSFFHAFSLVESSLATLGAKKGFTEAFRQGFGLPFVEKGLRKLGIKQNTLLETAAAGERAERAGVKLGKASDVQFSIVDKNLTILENGLAKIPGAGNLIKKIPRKYFDFFNKPLWEGFHNPMKIIGFDTKVKSLVKANPNIPLAELERDAATFINNAFGAQNWEALMVNPKMRQILHWALLAPDWTISNLRIAGFSRRADGSLRIGSALRGAAEGTVDLATFGLTRTKRLKNKQLFGEGVDVSDDLIQSYWRNAIPVFYGAVALLNKASSGHWPWENAPGHELDIELPDRDEKGRIQYTKLGKQFREPLRWLTEPTKILGAKTSPVFQVLVEQLTGSSATGFPTEFAEGRGKPQGTFMESTPKRLKSIIDKFIPFSFRGGSVFFALPKSSFTNFKAIKELSKAMKKGDRELVNDILNLAQSGNLDVGFIKGQVKRNIGDPRGLLEGESASPLEIGR